ncbi:unnamed protein product, partial [marine sediment metagenome]
MKKFILVVSLVAAMSSIGCVALSEYATPASIDQSAVDYAVRAGVADPEDYAGYKNLAKANKLAWDVDDAHEINQLALNQKIEVDSVEYAQLTETVMSHVTQARQSE